MRMRYIANIVSGFLIEAGEFFNVVKSLEEITEKNVPTLICGWSLVRSLYPEQEILNRRISDNLYWTFGKTERRNIFEKELLEFKKLAMRLMEERIRYAYINVALMRRGRLMDFLRMLNNGEEKEAFFTETHIYIHSSGYVFGFSIPELEYLGMDIKRIYGYLKNVRNLYLTSNEKEISFRSRKMVEERRYLMPYLIHLKKH